MLRMVWMLFLVPSLCAPGKTTQVAPEPRLLLEELDSLFPPADTDRIESILRQLQDTDQEAFCQGSLMIARWEKINLLSDQAVARLKQIVAQCENRAYALYELADLASLQQEYCGEAIDAVQIAGQPDPGSEDSYFTTLSSELVDLECRRLGISGERIKRLAEYRGRRAFGDHAEELAEYVWQMMAYDVNLRAQRLGPAKDFLREAVEAVCADPREEWAGILAEPCRSESELPPAYEARLDTFRFLFAVRANALLGELSRERKRCLRGLYEAARGACEGTLPAVLQRALEQELSE
jgi:hypothetical protein